jgi:hypothetical protein
MNFLKIIALCLIALAAPSSLAFSQIVGKIYLNGKEYKSGKDSLNYFSFKPLSTELTKEGEKFLDSFGNFYSKSENHEDSLKLILDPSLTPNEYKVVNNEIGVSRAWIAHSYLAGKFGIKINKPAIKHPSLLACALYGIVVK